MFYRFEVNGEGVFQADAICDLNSNVITDFKDKGAYFDCISKFNDDLIVPRVCKCNDTRSYFTDNGYDEFKDAIETYVGLAKKYVDNELILATIILNEIEEKIIYEDRYQVASLHSGEFYDPYKDEV